MKQRMIICIFFLLIGKGSFYAQQADTLLTVFWNLENFFDYTDEGGGDSDSEFSSTGSRRWTKSRFYTKCDAVAKSIMWLADRYGRMPDIIGLAEIENRGVLSRLLHTTLLRKYDYGVIHRESGDRRGIDCALLYMKSSFECMGSTFVTPVLDGKKLSTRDILHARMLSVQGDVLDFIVNHHPSKFGGSRESEGRRNAAMMCLRALCDSLAISSPDGIVAMGDFNDNPLSPPFEIVDDILVNKGIALHEKGTGSIRYEGRWELIDMFMVSHGLEDRCLMEVCRIPFLMVRDSGHPGEKPFRTYSGPRYIGGISDHCPVVLKLF